MTRKALRVVKASRSDDDLDASRKGLDGFNHTYTKLFLLISFRIFELVMLLIEHVSARL